MSPAYIDCPAPKEVGGSNARNESSELFHAWNWQYAALLHSVMAKAFGSKQPTYVSVLSMDRQIRDFPVNPIWRPDCKADVHNVPLELHIQRWMTLALKETTLLNLHRAYFARALQEMPNDLMRHRYIPSVMAVYRSAWRISKGLDMTWKNAAQVLMRITIPWSQGLSAAIVMCLLVTYAPTSSISQSALTELDCLARLYKDAASTSKAHVVVDGNLVGGQCAELDRWGGKTHLLAEVGTPDSYTAGPSNSVTLTAMGSEFWSDAQVGMMHPALAEDMRCFEVGSPIYSGFFDFPASVGSQQPPHSHSNAAQQPTPPMQEVHMDDPNFYNSAEYQNYQPQPHHSPFLQTAPILDATWQTFADQLGF
ncbi:hypothetical protein H0H87_007329 [Tephrocybe sp. NHM501043]|nr:hypothetical protein H0H87_007329 [Tephrocybe sp. NHM501043]